MNIKNRIFLLVGFTHSISGLQSWPIWLGECDLYDYRKGTFVTGEMWPTGLGKQGGGLCCIMPGVYSNRLSSPSPSVGEEESTYRVPPFRGSAQSGWKSSLLEWQCQYYQTLSLEGHGYNSPYSWTEKFNTVKMNILPKFLYKVDTFPNQFQIVLQVPIKLNNKICMLSDDIMNSKRHVEK